MTNGVICKTDLELKNLALKLSRKIESEPFVICLFGAPTTGKSLFARALLKYLSDDPSDDLFQNKSRTIHVLTKTMAGEVTFLDMSPGEKPLKLLEIEQYKINEATSNSFILESPKRNLAILKRKYIRFDFVVDKSGDSKVVLPSQFLAQKPVVKTPKIKNGFDDLGHEVVFTNHAIEKALSSGGIKKTTKSDISTLKNFLRQALSHAVKQNRGDRFENYKFKKYGIENVGFEYYWNRKFNIKFTVKRELKSNRIITIA